MLRGAFDLPFSLYFDFGFRYVDKIPTLKIEHYFNLDAQLTWQLNRKMKIAFVGQNLLEKQHTEYTPAYDDILSTDIPRGFFMKLQLQF